MKLALTIYVICWLIVLAMRLVTVYRERCQHQKSEAMMLRVLGRR